ncbi:hypothetical protein ACHWQZ_G000501 [Mnemiopsis leidyi]
MFHLSEEEVEEILEGHELYTLKNLVYFSRPNYFHLIHQQDSVFVDEVFSKLKWELPSYPSSYHHFLYNFVATYLATKGHPGRAEEYFLESLRLKPESEVTLSNYVIFLCDAGDREKTAIYFNKLNEVKAGSPEVKLDLAILFQLFNLNVAARVLLEDYISKSAITNDFVQFIFGRVLLEHSLGKMMYDVSIERAIKIFHDINKRSPMFLPNVDLLVKSLNHKWKCSQRTDSSPHPHSRFLSRKVQLSYPSHSHAWYLQGKIRMRVGEVTDAKEAFQRSIQLDQNMYNHYQLGKCHLALSHYQDAGLCFKQSQNFIKRTRVKFVLLEATALVRAGRRLDGLKLVNKAMNRPELTKHEKQELELFSAEHNIAAFPEVSSALESTLALLYKSYYKRLYDRLIKVVKVFTQHLSQYYCTTGLPQTQAETLLKWINFLKDRGEISDEDHKEMLKVKESLAVKQPGRRISTTNRQPMSRRRSSVFSPAMRTSPELQHIGSANLGPRARRRSVVHAPILVTPEILTPRSSFILSLDSNNVTEQNEQI